MYKRPYKLITVHNEPDNLNHLNVNNNNSQEGENNSQANANVSNISNGNENDTQEGENNSQVNANVSNISNGNENDTQVDTHVENDENNTHIDAQVENDIQDEVNHPNYHLNVGNNSQLNHSHANDTRESYRAESVRSDYSDSVACRSQIGQYDYISEINSLKDIVEGHQNTINDLCSEMSQQRVDQQNTIDKLISGMSQQRANFQQLLQEHTAMQKSQRQIEQQQQHKYQQLLSEYQRYLCHTSAIMQQQLQRVAHEKSTGGDHLNANHQQPPNDQQWQQQRHMDNVSPSTGTRDEGSMQRPTINTIGGLSNTRHKMGYRQPKYVCDVRAARSASTSYKQSKNSCFSPAEAILRPVTSASY